MFEKLCGNDTEKGCSLDGALGVINVDPDEWLEETVWYGMRMWHVIFLSIGVALGFTILLCCCFKFRIPRTKQEIEGDYIRRRIMRKFRKRLKAIQNQELDEMDLKKALDKIRTELKSDTESLQQSDVLSGATLSSVGLGNPVAGSTYRRASQIQIDISLEDLRIQSLGLGARIALAFNRFFGRSKRPPKSSNEDENGVGDTSPETGDKLTTALLPKHGGNSKTDKQDEIVEASKKKGKDDNKSMEATSSNQDKRGEKSKEKSKESGKTKGSNKKEETPQVTTITTETETKKVGKKGEQSKAKEQAAPAPKQDDKTKKNDKKDDKKSNEKKEKEKGKKSQLDEPKK